MFNHLHDIPKDTALSTYISNYIQYFQNAMVL
jgi:hypothetical protein